MKSAQLHDGDYITFGRYAGKSLIFRSGLEPQLKMENIDLDKDHLVIGRDPSCDVVIASSRRFEKHAEIVKQNGKSLIVDLGSVNGTFVNGIRVKRHELQDLDRVVIGPSELHFHGGTLTHVPDRPGGAAGFRAPEFPGRRTTIPANPNCCSIIFPWWSSPRN